MTVTEQWWREKVTTAPFVTALWLIRPGTVTDIIELAISVAADVWPRLRVRKRRT